MYFQTVCTELSEAGSRVQISVLIARSGFLGSPIPGRKRFPSDPQYHYHHGSTSPLVLQRFYHQQNQHIFHPHHHNFNSYPVHQSLTRQSSTDSSSETQKQDDSSGVSKKRFASYIKFHLGGGDSRSRNLPPPRPIRRASPGPTSHYPAPSQSPDPPPRHNRGSSTPADTGTPGPGSSPLLVRRSFLDVSPVRRGFVEGSPSLSRR